MVYMTTHQSPESGMGVILDIVFKTFEHGVAQFLFHLLLYILCSEPQLFRQETSSCFVSNLFARTVKRVVLTKVDEHTLDGMFSEEEVSTASRNEMPGTYAPTLVLSELGERIIDEFLVEFFLLPALCIFCCSSTAMRWSSWYTYHWRWLSDPLVHSRSNASAALDPCLGTSYTESA